MDDETTDDAPESGDPDGGFSPGRQRRRFLAAAAALGTGAFAGCLGDDGGSSGDDDGSDDGNGSDGGPTVFVFNTGEGTVSVVDPATDEVVETLDVDLTSSFPSNQFAPRLTDAPEQSLWLNVDRGVRALEVGTLAEVASVETGSGANWQERSPDGARVVVSAREPAHRQVLIDADIASETFGEELESIDRPGDGDGAGPCDVTFHPDGEYAYVPDLFADTLTVIDVDSFEIESQTAVESAGDGPSRPWMGTASWDGQYLLVEHDEGETGTESVWDVSDPAEPRELARLGADEGLGENPLTSEIGPDSETGYVLTPDTGDVTVIDLGAREVTDRIDLGGSAFVGTWDPGREKLYLPVRSSDEVAVVDHATGEVETRIDVGARPYGATAARVRPDATAGLDGAQAEFVGSRSYDTTYCIGNCACGHEL